MKFIKQSLLWGILTWQVVQAAPTTLNPEKVLSFTVANKGITRISIDQDRIVDTFVDPQEATAAIKNNRGHLYISGQRSVKTLYISLITKSGHVQDIKLSFQDKPAQPIWLKKPLEVVADKTTLPDTYANLLQQFLKGQIPTGFTSQANPSDIPSRDVPGLKTRLSEVWRNDQGLHALIFELLADQDRVVTPEMFQHPNDRGLVCNTRELKKGQKARLVVLQQFPFTHLTTSRGHLS